DRRRADVLADEPGAVDLDEMAALEQADRAVHLGEQPRDRGLARARIPEEDEMLRRRRLRQPVLRAPSLYLEERRQRAHLVLHRAQPDEAVEVGLDLVERPLGLRASAELLAQPVYRVGAR